MVKFKATVEATRPISADPVMDFTMCVLNSVTVAHIQHLVAKTYAVHVALGEFYGEVGDLIDSFVESFQGKYGLLTNFPTSYNVPSMEPIPYLESLKQEVQYYRQANGFPQDSELQNEVDNIANLINSTLNKLKHYK